MKSEFPVYPTEEDRAAAAEAYYGKAVPAGHRAYSWVVSGEGQSHVKDLEVLIRIATMRAKERARVKEACARICGVRSFNNDGLRDVEAAECAEAIRGAKL